MMKTVNRDSKKQGRVLPVSRFCSLIVVAALLICLCLALVGCQPSGTGEGTVTLVVETGDSLAEYSVRLEDLGEGADAVALLDYLKENEGLEYEATDGGFGLYLTKVGEVEEDMAAGVFVGIWTSYEGDFDVSIYATTKEYGDITLTSSGVGLSSMHIEDGVVIYIGEMIYG